MRRHALIVLLCLAFASAALAGIKTNHFGITTEKGTWLAVEGGELVLGKRTDWNEAKAAPERWLVEAGQIRNSTSGLYLTYDPEDKEGKVFLARKPVKGAGWVIDRKSAKRSDEAEERGEWGALQAASGPLKGCLLDLEMTEKKGDRTRGPVRLLLRKQPKRQPEIGRLYEHK